MNIAICDSLYVSILHFMIPNLKRFRPKEKENDEPTRNIFWVLGAGQATASEEHIDQPQTLTYPMEYRMDRNPLWNVLRNIFLWPRPKKYEQKKTCVVEKRALLEKIHKEAFSWFTTKIVGLFLSHVILLTLTLLPSPFGSTLLQSFTHNEMMWCWLQTNLFYSFLNTEPREVSLLKEIQNGQNIYCSEDFIYNK